MGCSLLKPYLNNSSTSLLKERQPNPYEKTMWLTKVCNNDIIIITFLFFFAWIIYQVLKFIRSIEIHRYNGLEPQTELVKYLKQKEEKT